MAEAGKGDSLAVLLKSSKDFDVSAPDDSGNTALHLAAKSGHLHCCRLLVQHGAKADVQNLQGQTPEDVAFHNSNLQCSEYLRAVIAASSFASPIVRSSRSAGSTPRGWHVTRDGEASQGGNLLGPSPHTGGGLGQSLASTPGTALDSTVTQASHATDYTELLPSYDGQPSSARQRSTTGSQRATIRSNGPGLDWDFASDPLGKQVEYRTFTAVASDRQWGGGGGAVPRSGSLSARARLDC